MQKTIDFINQNLNKEHLEEMAVTIIDAYKHGNQSLLRTYVESLMGSMASEGKDRKALFFTVIKLIHPDRLPGLLQDFKQAQSANDHEKLKYLENLLSVRTRADQAYKSRFDFTPAPEEYTFDDDEFEDYSIYEDDDISEVVVDENREMSFMDAVKQYIFGNLDIDEILPFDLGQLEGSLDVSHYGLYELDGLEYCTNITELNLAGNNIDNIYNLRNLGYLQEIYMSDNQISNLDPLANLQSLEILDLENNEVEDIQVLLSLEGLQFVNLKKNPLHLQQRNQTVIKELKSRGVLVIY